MATDEVVPAPKQKCPDCDEWAIVRTPATDMTCSHKCMECGSLFDVGGSYFESTTRKPHMEPNILQITCSPDGVILGLASNNLVFYWHPASGSWKSYTDPLPFPSGILGLTL